MIDRPGPRDAQALYSVVAGGGLALAPTATGYRLVAMRSAAVRRGHQLTGPATPPAWAVLVTPAVLDDIAAGLDAATRVWLTAATARWPLGVVAPRHPRSPLLARAEPFVVAQCTSDDGIAACFGLGPLLKAAVGLAARHGHVLVGASASATGTGPNYQLDDVPAAIRRGVDLVCAATAAPPAAARRLPATVLDLHTGVFLRRGAAFDDLERAWVMRDRQQPAATA